MALRTKSGRPAGEIDHPLTIGGIALATFIIGSGRHSVWCPSQQGFAGNADDGLKGGDLAFRAAQSTKRMSLPD
jgi:hypothetical protein